MYPITGFSIFWKLNNKISTLAHFTATSDAGTYRINQFFHDKQSQTCGMFTTRRFNAIKLRQTGGKMGRRERQKWGGGRNEQG